MMSTALPVPEPKKVRGESIGMLIAGLEVHRCDVDNNPMLHHNALARAERKRTLFSIAATKIKDDQLFAG